MDGVAGEERAGSGQTAGVKRAFDRWEIGGPFVDGWGTGPLKSAYRIPMPGLLPASRPLPARCPLVYALTSHTTTEQTWSGACGGSAIWVPPPEVVSPSGARAGSAKSQARVMGFE